MHAFLGEDTNLDDALNSIDNEPPLLSEDFHDALDEMNGENGGKRSDKNLPTGNSVDLIAIGSIEKSSAFLANGEAPPCAINGNKSSKSKKSKNRNKNKAKPKQRTEVKSKCKNVPQGTQLR